MDMWAMCALIIVLIALSFQYFQQYFNIQSHKRTVIIDHDGSWEDTAAILAIMQYQNIQILAITSTGSGEAHCQQSIELIQNLLVYYKRNIPFACGQDNPMDGFLQFPKFIRDNADNLPNEISHFFEIDENNEDKIRIIGMTSELKSSDLIIKQLKEQNDKVEFVVLGPLTNLALAFKQDPILFRDKTQRIFIMGGAVSVKGNINIPNKHESENLVSEWNFYADALAAQIILRSGLPITLIPLDGTKDVPIRHDFIAKFHSLTNDSKVANLIYNIYTNHTHYQQDSTKQGELQHWDTLTAMEFVHGGICEYQNLSLDVRFEVNDKDNQGQIRRHFKEINAGQVIQSTDIKNYINVCIRANKTIFDQRFIETFSTKKY